MMRKVADEEARGGLRFKIIENGGRTLKSELQRSNPTGTPGCNDPECLGCSLERGRGGKCRLNNVNYKIECLLCPEGNRPVYIGETSRNIYTRGKEHVRSGRRIGDTNMESCFVKKHMAEMHEGSKSRFSAKVTHRNRDCLSRQVREGILIRKSSGNTMNTRSEWSQPPIYSIQSHVIRE